MGAVSIFLIFLQFFYSYFSVRLRTVSAVDASHGRAARAGGPTAVASPLNDDCSPPLRFRSFRLRHLVRLTSK